MTGFGKSSGSIAGNSYIIEIRTLNSKSLDLNLRLPQIWRPYEMKIRQWAQENIIRGKADIYISQSSEESLHNTNVINTTLAKAYAEEIRTLAEVLGQTDYDLLTHVLKMPDVLKPEPIEATEEEYNDFLNLFNQAVEQLNDFRLKEGEKTEVDLKNNFLSIERGLEQIIGLDKDRLNLVKEKLHKAMAENKLTDVFDANRLEQEVIFYLEKLDINEEKIRLKSHLEFAKKTMETEENQGKKLGFIAQEVGREINTIGSKCNHAEMQKIVVEMKDSLEKIKEQVLNIL